MKPRFFALAMCVSFIQYPSCSLDILATQGNVEFARDFEEIRRLGKARDSVGLEGMVDTVGKRWKDIDMDAYCRLMNEVLGGWRNEFHPVDYRKLKGLSDDVLSDLDTKLKEGIDPILVPHYYQFQEWYISAAYGAKYSTHTVKGDTKDEAWVNQRKDVMTRLLKVWKLIQDTKDSTWSINKVFPAQVMPPNGAPPGTSPDSIKDPGVRAKYEADIRENDNKRRWWDAQYRLSQTEDMLKKRLLNDIKVMYNTPPLAPDELTNLLDTYVKDEEQKKMFLEASQK
jgi:hypothetical protein